jgi:CHAT domain-containing protein
VPECDFLAEHEKKRLPGTRGEVDAIGKLIKARGGKVEPLLGMAANRKNLDLLADQQKLQKFRYLHLATHGTPDAMGAMNSFLALASEDFELMPYDKLTAGHILRTWKLDADLVTLSACETALGQLQGGEGYVGFAQALFLAGQKGVGARTVVMSQWQVNDYSTALLMERFYQNLLGQRKDLKAPMGKLAALTEARHYLRGLTREEALARLKALGLDTDPRPQGPVTLTGRRPFAQRLLWTAGWLCGDQTVDPGRSESAAS